MPGTKEDPATVKLRRRERCGRILVVDDDELVREHLRDLLGEAGYDVSTAEDGQEALEALSTRSFDLVLLDLQLPRVSGLNVLAAVPSLQTHARFVAMTAFGTVDSAVEAMKRGALDYVRKPFGEDEILLVVGRIMEEIRLRSEVRRLRQRAGDGTPYGMVGRAPPMLELYRRIDRVAPTRATVLVSGETGTGKELVAKAVHDLSGRSPRPFVAVNCSALPETLLESELFGHVRGSFTGAVQSRRGLIEEAQGGTLFLDEVGTLSEDTQVKLLRVIEERRVRRVGATASSPVDFRLVAATNVDLRGLVEGGSFREDLFFRLDVFPIVVPPLRERPDDIPLLTEHFRRRFAEELDVEPPTIGPETLARMMEYEWPGNVRELENFVERSVIMHAGGGPVPFDLPRRRRSNPASNLLERACDADWSLDRLEREYILAVLDRVRWQQGTAAEILGVNRRTVHRKLKRYRDEGALPEVDGPTQPTT